MTKSKKKKFPPVCDGSYDCATDGKWCDKCVRNHMKPKSKTDKDYYTKPKGV